MPPAGDAAAVIQLGPCAADHPLLHSRELMRSLLSSVLSSFLSPAGLVVLGALDASLIFFLPLGIDFALIVVTAREPQLFWAHALAATAGSVLGAAVTFWLGRTLGEKGLERWLGKARLERVQGRVSGKAASGVAALAIIPPPFPFTGFVLAAGAFGLDVWKFLGTLAIVRLLRFGVEAWLASEFGPRITTWMESTVFEVVVGGFIATALVGTAISVYRIVRKS